MLDAIRLAAKSNYAIFKLLRFPLSIAGYYKRKIFSATLDEFWTNRIETVIKSPDNAKIERVPRAGEILGDTQIMHNGIRIHVGSYYGDGNTVLLHRNRGVHEPQEEKVFEEILKYLPSGSTMLELGSFWAFYSMSFLSKVNGGISYLIEPDAHALISGRNNFKLNGFKGNFFRYRISDNAMPGPVATISVDRFLENQNISHLNILHSDIQGFELAMLKGASESLARGAIDYVFISTHSNDLHGDCKKFLEQWGYVILCDADLEETYSWDGLIVARSGKVSMPGALEISKKR